MIPKTHSTLPPLAAEPDPTLGQRLCLVMVCVTIAAVTGGLLALNRFERGLTADALIPSLASLYAWTPFFWRQDRYGMVLPLLVRPITHPFVNLLVLSWLHITLSALAFPLIARFFGGKKSPWLATGWLALSVHLLLGSKHFIYETLGLAQFFTPALSFGLGGLLLIEHQRRPAHVAVAGLLMALGGWFNVAVPPMLLLWILLRAGWELAAGSQPTWTHHPKAWWQIRLAWPLITCVSGSLFGASLLFTSAFRQLHLFSTTFSPPDIFSGINALWADMNRELGQDADGKPLIFYGFFALGFLGLLLHVMVAKNKETWCKSIKPVALGLGSGAVWVVAMASHAWVRQEQYGFRFLSPCIVVAQVVLVMWCLYPLATMLSPRRRWLLTPSMVVIVWTMCVLRLGWPSYQQTRADFDAWAGDLSEDLIAQRVTHLAGDYWATWPRVFHTNNLRYERGIDGPMWTTTGRSEATASLWPSDQTTWRVAYVKGDPRTENITAMISAGRLRRLYEDEKILVVATMKIEQE